MNTLTTCFVPELYEHYHNPEATVVVVDVLRATTSICTAFMHGARAIIPVSTIPEALTLKKQGYPVAAERDGIKRDFADFGNSPFHFSVENVQNREVVYTTTNGTRTIHAAARARSVVIGAFINLQAVANRLASQQADVLVLCAGWKGRFNLEDSLFAGALAEILLEKGFETRCDSTLAALDLWSLAKPDLRAYVRKAAQFTRLHAQNIGESIDYCLTTNLTDLVPEFMEGKLEIKNKKPIRNNA